MIAAALGENCKARVGNSLLDPTERAVVHHSLLTSIRLTADFCRHSYTSFILGFDPPSQMCLPERLEFHLERILHDSWIHR
jgi:hypothetical protein